MKMKPMAWVATFASLAVVGYIFRIQDLPGFQADSKSDVLDQSAIENRNMTVDNYVRLHISELSPISATLGGRFYVTKVATHGGAGTVYFEDGHNAYIADFKYSVDKSGAVSVDSIAVRK